MIPPCQRCSGIHVVRYNDEMLCGPCFLAESRSLAVEPVEPGEEALPQWAVALMNQLIELLRKPDRQVMADTSDLTARLLHHERPS